MNEISCAIPFKKIYREREMILTLFEATPSIKKKLLFQSIVCENMENILYEISFIKWKPSFVHNFVNFVVFKML